MNNNIDKIRNINEYSNITESISLHTIKKFEIIEKYVEAWAHILFESGYCKKLVYIDCMSNSGVYKLKDSDKIIFGSPIRVTKILRNIAFEYPNMQVYVYFNDIDNSRIKMLESINEKSTKNLFINYSNKDGNEFLLDISKNIDQSNSHIFLLYDPYKACIDWHSLYPYFHKWCEILINHMVLDPVRSITSVKNDETKEKFLLTYLYKDFNELLKYGTDRKKYEERIETIIKKITMFNNKDNFISAFPVFNEKNSLLYHLIHWTSNIKGKKLFKKCAWKTFGDKSSNKSVDMQQQYVFGISDDGSADYVANTDCDCYKIADIVEYLHHKYTGKTVKFEQIYCDLDIHPIFPSDGYKDKIKIELKNVYNDIIKKDCIIFK